MKKKIKNETPKKRKGLRITAKLITGILIFLAFLILFACIWMTRKINLNATGWDAVIFTLTSDLSGTDPGIILDIILMGVLPVFACTAVCIWLLSHLPYHLPKKAAKWREKLKEIKYQKIQRLVSLIIAVALFLSMAIFATFRLGLVRYVVLKSSSTELYNEYYVNPNDVKITFPEEKQNLIYIFLESMENSYMSPETGGTMEENLIPELTKLAQENLNFSHTDLIGGPRTTTGSTWTIAAMISQTSGIPLCMPEGIDTNALNQFVQVMPGLTTVNDILKANGYNQALLVGSDSEFGGRQNYFSQHGIDASQIYDLYTARKVEGLLPSDDYHYGWGMEDHYLFDYAKQILPELASGEEPFAFTMLTVDTHYPRGFTCKYCENSTEHEEPYANVVSCSSRQVSEFVEWIQQQDFAENTTIIIVGDHYTMDNQYLGSLIPGEYVRTVYNCILNPVAEAVYTKNREFTTLDMFPTTLAAIGCTIEGERLGLGTNMFSDKETLSEQLGFQFLCDEIFKKSDYYYDTFFYDRTMIDPSDNTDRDGNGKNSDASSDGTAPADKTEE